MRQLFVSILAGLGLYACTNAEARDSGPAAPPAPAVSTALPVTAKATEWNEYTGHVEAVASVEVRARVSGYLTRVGFIEGDIVQKGALLYALDARPYEAELARAEGELARAQANVGFAERDSARAERLIAAQAIAERERDTTQSALDQQKAAVRVATAAVAAARLNVEYARLTSPITGRVGRTSVTAGNLVQANGAEPLTTIVAVDPLYVYVDIDEARALQVAQAAKADKVKAYVGVADEEGYPHHGVLDWIDNRANPSTGTVRARAVIPNPDGRLRPGLFARLRIPAATIEDALLISERAVGTDQDRKFVYVVNDDKVEYRAIRLGAKYDGLRIVRDGLKPSDRIVVSGLQRVRPGSVVAAKDVAMADSDGSAK